MNNSLGHFPTQKRSDSQKTKKWYKECVDSVDESGFLSDEGVRASWEEKIINVNLYNGIISKKDIVKTLNPEGLSEELMGVELQHYPIANSRLDVLIGEEAKRRFDWKVMVTNPDAISEKEEELNFLIKNRIKDFLETKYEGQELQEKIQDLDRDIRSFQDKREIRATRLLKHYYNEQKMARLFNHGFRDVLLQGEEYYEAVIVSGEPRLFKLDPQKVFWTRSSFSNKIEDANLIILDDYWSPTKVLDFYYDDLKPSDIKKIESNLTEGGYDLDEPFVDKRARGHINVDIFDSENPVDAAYINNLIGMGQGHGYQLSEPYDASGNVRVLRVYWKGFRKAQKVTYFDEYGDPQTDIFPENYTPKKDEGETTKEIWLPEWYEATKIGKDIYVQMRPKPVQYRKLSDPAYCHPGICGKTYSVNSHTTVSLMSKVKNFSYLYDAIHDRLNKTTAANQGKILVLDTAGIPAELGIEQWFHYLKKMKVAIYDSFKEGNKGVAKGKLFGGLNNNRQQTIDMDTSQAIQSYIALLQFIKMEIAELTGVTDQRLGQISNRETVGGVERSVVQSNHITEWYFAEHDEVKIDALTMFLETAKLAFRGQSKKLQYILDDQSIQLSTLDGDEFAESDYGLLVTTSSKTQEAEMHLKRLAETALSAGAASFSTVASIYLSDSISDIKRKLEREELEKRQEAREQAQMQEETKRQALQQEALDKERDREVEVENNIRDNQTKMAIKAMDNVDFSDNQTDSSDVIFKQQERKDKLKMFYDKLAQDKKEHDDEMKLKNRDLSIKARKPTTK